MVPLSGLPFQGCGNNNLVSLCDQFVQRISVTKRHLLAEIFSRALVRCACGFLSACCSPAKTLQLSRNLGGTSPVLTDPANASWEKSFFSIKCQVFVVCEDFCLLLQKNISAFQRGSHDTELGSHRSCVSSLRLIGLLTAERKWACHRERSPLPAGDGLHQCGS